MIHNLYNSVSYCMPPKDVFASLFETNDLVASDVAAALVLLRLQRKAEEEQEETFRRNNLHLPISRASTASIGQC